MSGEKSNELLAQEIGYVKERLVSIEKKLDEKYISHETFDLTVNAINKSVQTVIYTGLFLMTPIYGAVVALLFKIFTNAN